MSFFYPIVKKAMGLFGFLFLSFLSHINRKRSEFEFPFDPFIADSVATLGMKIPIFPHLWVGQLPISINGDT